MPLLDNLLEIQQIAEDLHNHVNLLYSNKSKSDGKKAKTDLLKLKEVATELRRDVIKQIKELDKNERR